MTVPEAAHPAGFGLLTTLKLLNAVSGTNLTNQIITAAMKTASNNTTTVLGTTLNAMKS